MKKPTKRKVYRIQEKSAESAESIKPKDNKPKVENENEADKNKIKKQKAEDELTELVRANKVAHILGFAKDVLGIAKFKDKTEVLNYMLKSIGTNDGSALKYFINELKDYLEFKKHNNNSGESGGSSNDDNIEEQSNVGVEESSDEPDPQAEVPEWEQDMPEGTDAVEFMKEHFQQAKERLQNMLDRITICENRLDDHDVKIGEIDGTIIRTDNSGSGVGDVTKEQLVQMKQEFFSEIESLKTKMDEVAKRNSDNNGNGGSEGSTYKITYPDKPTKTIKAVLPPIWKKLMDLATTRSNIFLAGPTQCGKTKTAEMLAEALDLRFSALSCSEGIDEGVFQGRLLPIGENGKFEYVPSDFVDFYENGGVFLFDEFCASDSNLGVFTNNAMGNDKFYLPIRYENPLVKRHPDFICIGADNTLGHGGDDMYVGRNQMDASTMERFRTGFLVMDYSEKIEKSLADEDVYDWAIMIRKGIKALQMNRAMTTRSMKEFTKMKNERQWTLRDMESVYFADWPKDDVKRLLQWIKVELQNIIQGADSK